MNILRKSRLTIILAKWHIARYYSRILLHYNTEDYLHFAIFSKEKNKVIELKIYITYMNYIHNIGLRNCITIQIGRRPEKNNDPNIATLSHKFVTVNTLCIYIYKLLRVGFIPIHYYGYNTGIIEKNSWTRP